jgi:hypothetical protein
MAVTPSTSLATLRPDLAASFEAFDLAEQEAGFVASKILPFIPVGEAQGNYGFFPPEEMVKNSQDARSPGGAYDRGSGTFKPLTYHCQEHGGEEPVDDREAKMYRNYFDAESYAARRRRNIILRNREARVIAFATDATNNFTAALGNYGVQGAGAFTTASGGATGEAWANQGTSDPVTDVAIASNLMWLASGLKPNIGVISYARFWNLRRNASIQSQIKYSGLADPAMAANTARSIISELFGLELVVAGSVTNIAKEGQVFSGASMWTDSKFLLAKAATSGDFREACLGRTFHWSEDGSSENGTVETYRDETVRSNIVRVRMDVDEQIILPTAGYLLTGI